MQQRREKRSGSRFDAGNARGHVCRDCDRHIAEHDRASHPRAYRKVMCQRRINPVSNRYPSLPLVAETGSCTAPPRFKVSENFDGKIARARSHRNECNQAAGFGPQHG